MKRILVFSLVCLVLTGCQRSCTRVQREYNYDDAVIRHYSGGKLIGEWKSDGPVNNSKSSDGYYFLSNGKTIEVAGDVQIFIGGLTLAEMEESRQLEEAAQEPERQREATRNRDTLRPYIHRD